MLSKVPFARSILDFPSQRRLAAAVNIADIRECARQRTFKHAFDYLDAGADDEVSIRRGKDAFTQIEMHFHVLSGLSPPLNLSSKVFGKQVSLPFFTCPTAGNRMFHTEGEAAVAKAAQRHGMAYGLSSLSTTPIAEITKFHTGPKVFQLYVWKDRELVKSVLSQAKEAGFESMALTVDFTWLGKRERDTRNGFTIPPAYNANQVVEAMKRPAWTWDFLSNKPFSYSVLDGNAPADSLASFVSKQISPSFGWKDAEWLLGEWGGHSCIKGVVRPDDALKAKRTGFDCVWISNHGGRQLDTSPATIDVVESIREAVGADAELILDGGIQRGSDIVKALALGADSVGIGKP